ncbi:MAG: DUF1302 family protein [Sulfurimonas sp.]
MLRYLATFSLLLTALWAENADDLFMDGFEEAPAAVVIQEPANDTFSLQEYGFEGELTQQAAYSYHNEAPHDKLSSLRTSFFLEYNKDLWQDFKLKINANSFYDSSYLLKGREKFTSEELNSLESEVELFDAYIQGSITDDLDIKIGRQVVVWGKSDTIRVVDVLNPLDNRRPAMVDIEDLRLSTAMAKFDYYYKNWSITPILVLEQREDKLPPFGGDFNPAPIKVTTPKKPNELTYALNISGEFTGFDLDFYYANIYPNFEFYPRNDVDITNKIDMYGAAVAYVYGSWLFKSELAYKQNYKYLQFGDEKFDRLDMLVGLEYSGISETTVSLDLSECYYTKNHGFSQKNYQGALRISSDFYHERLHANYLLSLLGEQFNDGGYQRAWLEYENSDSVKTTLGIVDYIGGSTFFDNISDNDMIFGEISYSF